MAKKIYVGNLSYGTTEAALTTAFAQFGEVASASIITDRYSGQSKGFGFVEMVEEEAADAAIGALNNSDLDGRRLRVNEAIDKPRRPRHEFNNDRGGNDRW
ncbi:MAG: RNA-binding protein [Treponema sp. CETP13]|nr:MAG: RNA-binding protein [Treponema sp. CETP13]